MQSIELIVNGEALDLGDKATVSLVLQAQDWGDISEKVGSFSRSFIIPVTEKNRRVLDNVYTYQSNTSFAYKRHEAVLKVNGIEMPRGAVIVESDGMSANEIRLTFYTGNSPFYQFINSIKLRNLPYYSAQHHLWQKTIYEARDCTKDYLYPLVAYSDDITDISATTTNDINLRTMLPALRLSYVMNEIQSETGYTFTGELFNDTLYSSLVFPFSESKLTRDKNPEYRNSWKTQNLTTQNILQAGVPINTGFKVQIATADVDGFPIDANGNSQLIPYIVTHPVTAYNRLRFYVDSGLYRIKINFNFSNTFSAPIKVYPTLTNLYGAFTCVTTELDPSGNGAVYYGSQTSSGTGLNGNNPIPFSPFGYRTELEYYTQKTAHSTDTFEVYSNQDWAIISITYEQEFIEDRGTTDADRLVDYDTSPTNIMQTTGYPFLSRSIFSPSQCLPDFTVGAFLKSIANLFGCIVFVNENIKQVEFCPLSKVAENIPFAKDWTDKVVNVNANSWNSRPPKYAQSNYFAWENIDAVGANFGLYTLPIEDTTLPVEFTMVKLPYSGSNNLTRLNGEQIAYIQRYNDYDELEGDDNKQRILILDQLRVAVPPFYFSIVHNSGGLVYTDNTTTAKTAYFYREAGMPVGSKQLTWSEYLYPNYYNAFTEIVNRYRELNCFMLLSAVDVQTLDYKTPIYLQQYNSYFYIQKVGDWTGDKPVKVELLKLQ